MTVLATPVTVTTTATLLSAAPADANTRFTVTVAVPTGGATVYVGPAGVTTATGFPLVAGAAVDATLEVPEALYGVVASGAQVVNRLVSGL